MKKLAAGLLTSSALLLGCATPPTVPVAVDCPLPPPLPHVLTSTVSSGPSLSERMESLLSDYLKARDALLMKAQRQP